MKPGSVIVDLAGEAGGNCELTEPGQTVVKHEVKIVSPLNLPAAMAEHSSQLFARNVQALLELFVGEDGALQLDFEDEIVKGACVVRDGEIVHAGRPRRRGGRRSSDHREHAHHQPRDPRARGLHRLRRDLEGARTRCTRR